MSERFSHFEAAAMPQRADLWAAADPERLAELRAEQRAEERELRKIQKDVQGRQ